MAKFMDIHNGFIGVTELQLREAVGRDLAVEAADGVHFEHTWLDAEAGTVFCLSSGPSKEAVRRVHDQAGHPAQEIYELSVEVEEPTPRGATEPHRSGRDLARYKGAHS